MKLPITKPGVVPAWIEKLCCTTLEFPHESLTVSVTKCVPFPKGQVASDSTWNEPFLFLCALTDAPTDSSKNLYFPHASLFPPATAASTLTFININKSTSFSVVIFQLIIGLVFVKLEPFTAIVPFIEITGSKKVSFICIVIFWTVLESFLLLRLSFTSILKLTFLPSNSLVRPVGIKKLKLATALSLIVALVILTSLSSLVVFIVCQLPLVKLKNCKSASAGLVKLSVIFTKANNLLPCAHVPLPAAGTLAGLLAPR